MFWIKRPSETRRQSVADLDIETIFVCNHCGARETRVNIVLERSPFYKFILQKSLRGSSHITLRIFKPCGPVTLNTDLLKIYMAIAGL